MTREEAKELLPVIQAFAEGKKIEYSNDGENWTETVTPTWDTNCVYRIKPEPKYRPFKTLEECWQEMLKHQPFGWIKSKYNTEVVQIGRLLETGGCGCQITLSIEEKLKISISYFYENYTFTDGTPFGIMETEQ